MAEEYLDKYLSEAHIEILHQGAIKQVLDVLHSFIQAGDSAKQDKVSWVCDAVMGSGKTTALKVFLKQLIDSKDKAPLLLVFNEKSLMKEIYEDVLSYGKMRNGINCIEYVDAENVNDVEHTLKQYQFVCITHQRLRDLTLGYGNKYSYQRYNSGSELFPNWQERSVVVDEMPLLFDSCVFDLSSQDNSVDWFDDLADGSDLSPSERQFGRTMIAMLITYEMLKSEGERTYTMPLIDGIGNSDMQRRFEDIMGKLVIDNKNFESLRKMKWFQKLLYEEKVGAIDRSIRGTSVICSQIIPYHEKENILVLDGTAKWNQIAYEGMYTVRTVTNYHDYHNRVTLHVRDINTSQKVREDKKNDIQGKITSDINKISEKKCLNIFPLASKSDILPYKKSGLISGEHTKFYETKSAEDSSLPINLLNTRGKNALKDYNSIALLNLPIRNPQYYKQIAIALFGVGVDLDQFDKREGKHDTKWFKDAKVQQVYEGSLLADVMQIIHRCSLRKIKDTSKVDVFLYTHLVGWGQKLQSNLGLPSEALTYGLADDKYNFISKCSEYARKTRDFLEKQADVFNNDAFFAKNITKDQKFKNWLKTNWDREYKTEKIIELFAEEGVEVILDTKSSGVEYKKFCLTDEVHEKMFE